MASCVHETIRGSTRELEASQKPPTAVTSVRASVAGVRRWVIWLIFVNGCGMSRRPTAPAHARGWRPLGQLDLIPLGGLVLGTHTQHSRYSTEICALGRNRVPWSRRPRGGPWEAHTAISWAAGYRTWPPCHAIPGAFDSAEHTIR